MQDEWDWADSALSAKIFDFLDGELLIFTVIWLFHWQWWTFYLMIGAMIAGWWLFRVGYRPVVAFRWVRFRLALLASPRRSLYISARKFRGRTGV